MSFWQQIRNWATGKGFKHDYELEENKQKETAKKELKEVSEIEEEIDKEIEKIKPTKEAAIKEQKEELTEKQKESIRNIPEERKTEKGIEISKKLEVPKGFSDADEILGLEPENVKKPKKLEQPTLTEAEIEQSKVSSLRKGEPEPTRHEGMGDYDSYLTMSEAIKATLSRGQQSARTTDEIVKTILQDPKRFRHSFITYTAITIFDNENGEQEGIIKHTGGILNEVESYLNNQGIVPGQMISGLDFADAIQNEQERNITIEMPNIPFKLKYDKQIEIRNIKYSVAFR